MKTKAVFKSYFAVRYAYDMGGINSLKVINHDQKLFIEWVDGFYVRS